MYDNNGRWIKITPEAFESLVNQWHISSNILMRRNPTFESEVAVSMGFGASGKFNLLNFWIEEDYFISPSNRENFLKMSIALWELFCPTYGKAHQTRDSLETSTIHDPRYGKTVVPVNLGKGLPGVYWANFFGPEYVKSFGEARLAAAPCNDIRELPDGGKLLITSPSPLDPSSDINRTQCKFLYDYLGSDNFYQ